MSTLIERIQLLRKEKGIKSIRQLEILAGIPVGTIREWDETPPRSPYLIQLADVLETSVDFLLDRSNALDYLDLHSSPNAEKIAKVAKKFNVDDTTTEIVIEVMRILMESKSDRT